MAGMTREEYEAVARVKSREARGARVREIDRLIVERGLRVEPLGSHGAKRIVGDGVDLLVGDWRALSPADLEPVRASSVLLGNRYR